MLSDYQHCVISIFYIKSISKIKHILDFKGNLNVHDHVTGKSETSLMDKMEESTPAFFGVGRQKISL